jgi:hypothetical protein
MVRMIEQAGEAVSRSPIARSTRRVPTDVFLLAAGGSILGSLVLKVLGRHRDAEFVGHWAPTLISLGLLSKLIDHDQRDRERQ